MRHLILVEFNLLSRSNHIDVVWLIQPGNFERLRKEFVEERQIPVHEQTLVHNHRSSANILIQCAIRKSSNLPKLQDFLSKSGR